MSKLIEFKVPTKSRGITTTKGRVAWLMVGDRKVKFVMQEDGWLSHYASGYIFGSMDNTRLELSLGSIKQLESSIYSLNRKFSDRQIAEHLIENVIKRKGLKHVLKVLDEAPVIND